MRTVLMVGAIRNRGVEMAVRCGWCQAWRSEADEAKAARGALISHNMCGSCATVYEAQLDAMDAEIDKMLPASGSTDLPEREK